MNKDARRLSDARYISSRGTIPKPGDVAGAYRKEHPHTNNIPDCIPDEAVLLLVCDFYPHRYAWSLQWSNGMSSGVRSDETDLAFVEVAEKALSLTPRKVPPRCHFCSRYLTIELSHWCAVCEPGMHMEESLAKTEEGRRRTRIQRTAALATSEARTDVTEVVPVLMCPVGHTQGVKELPEEVGGHIAKALHCDSCPADYICIDNRWFECP